MLSIISINYNNANLSAECVFKTVNVLSNQNIPFEYLLIDNHSTDDSFEKLRNIFKDHINVKVLRTDKNGGFGYGNNFGAMHASYNILWFLNSDAWCTSIYKLKELTDLITYPKTGLVSNIMKDFDGTVHPNGGAEVTFSYFLVSSFRPGMLYRQNKFIRKIISALLKNTNYIQAQKHDLIREPIAKQIVSGASFFIEKKKYLVLDGFDESFFLYDEDTDLCYRANINGLTNYVTAYAEVRTINHSTTSKLSPFVLKKIKLNSRLYFYRKHFKGFRRICLSIAAKLTWRLL